ncbi:MAG TPA: hypothetical protein VNW92_25885 [Polyangiaceae bacterium]|jgi:hypothetical protein|nr:hypothetical protein [Polyangiaceae bacterium]
MNFSARLGPSCGLSATSVLATVLLLGAGCSSSAGAGDNSSAAGTTSSVGTGGHAGTNSASGGGASSVAGASGSGGATASAGTTSSSAGTAGTSGASGAGGSSGQAGAGSGNACLKSNATCSGSNSGCNVGNYYLYDNQWNCAGNHCGPESAYGCLNSDGSVSFVTTSNQPTGNTAVLTYPAIQSNFANKPKLGSFSSISATFSETSPHIGDYEVAWDCWFNDDANELMVWVDTYKQVPGGNKVATAAMLGGHSYDVWSAPGSGTSGYLAFYANPGITSGTIDLLELFQYAVTHNWLPASSVVNQLSFGIEVCSTDDQDATWTVDNYSLTAK